MMFLATWHQGHTYHILCRDLSEYDACLIVTARCLWKTHHEYWVRPQLLLPACENCRATMFFRDHIYASLHPWRCPHRSKVGEIVLPKQNTGDVQLLLSIVEGTWILTRITVPLYMTVTKEKPLNDQNHENVMLTHWKGPLLYLHCHTCQNAGKWWDCSETHINNDGNRRKWHMSEGCMAHKTWSPVRSFTDYLVTKLDSNMLGFSSLKPKIYQSWNMGKKLLYVVAHI